MQSYLPLATLLIVLVATFPLIQRSWPLWSKIATRISVFVALTLVVQRLLVSPLDPHYSPAREGWNLWERAVEAGWWFVAANTLAKTGRLFVISADRRRETRIVSDLVVGAVYLATVLAIVNYSFDVPIRGVLATSGVIAIVLGLALQSSLSDVFSGLAIGLERPYNPGDVLWIEGNIEGRVVQINWRSTWIATGNDDIAIVPNSVLAKARIVNRSAPTQVRGDTITLDLDPNTPPERCTDVLVSALLSCRRILTSRAPSVACCGLKGDGARYEMSFFVASLADSAAARAEILNQTHRHLRFAGIALAVAGSGTVAKASIPAPWEVLEQSDVFGVMDEEDRNFLAEHFIVRWLEKGETLLREGEMSDALYVVASGAAEITQTENGGVARVLNRIGPGETLGALGLLTGQTNGTTVTALTPLKVFALTKDDIALAIKAKPEVALGMEALARRGQNALKRLATEREKKNLAEPDLLLHKLRDLLHILGT